MTKLREFRLTDRLSALFASRTAVVRDAEAGMSTVEYAIGIVGAGCAAGVLVTFLRSPAFGQIIKNLVIAVIKKMAPGF